MAYESETLLSGPGYRVLERDLTIRAVRSGGPGGQNVNKVSSKVVLHFRLDEAEGLSEHVRRRLHELYESRINARGELVIASDVHRDRPRNLEAALARLDAFLRDAARRPRVRRPTRPSRGAKERRLKAKRIRGEAKSRRRDVGPDE